MVTREQALFIMNKVKKNKPNDVFKNVSEMESGMRFVLLYLSEHSGEVYASTISEKMNISRARVAVLLKKMEGKGYITRRSSTKDARIEVINITQEGLDRLTTLQEDMINHISKVIEKVGYEQLNEFLDMAINIKNILEGEKNV